MAIEALTLESLDDNHERVGTELAGSVQRWLDAEWMPQQVHVDLGEAVKQTYIACRRDQGQADLSAIMIQVADDLSEDWMEKYNKDAFVNAWDIANYVSDFLTDKVGVEGCACSAKIH